MCHVLTSTYMSHRLRLIQNFYCTLYPFGVETTAGHHGVALGKDTYESVLLRPAKKSKGNGHDSGLLVQDCLQVPFN